MKTFICMAVLCLLGVATARRIAKESNDYEDYDWDKVRSCYQEMNQCYPRDFPFYQRLHEFRGPQDFEDFMEEANPKDICDGMLPLPQCQLNSLENLSEDCKPHIFRRSPVTYDEALSIGTEFLTMAEDVCTTKLDLLERNWQCIKNVALNRHMDLAMCTMGNPCIEEDTIIDCIKGVIAEESTCSEDFGEFVSGHLHEARDIMEPFCANSPMGGPPHKWMQFFLRR